MIYYIPCILLCLQEYRGHDQVSTAHPLKRIVPTDYLLPTTITSIYIMYPGIHVTSHISICTYIGYIVHLAYYKRAGLCQYCCFSFRKEQEKVLVTAHQQSRMEREEGQVRVVLYPTWTKVGGVVRHIAPPLPPDADCSRGDWCVCPSQ